MKEDHPSKGHNSNEEKIDKSREEKISKYRRRSTGGYKEGGSDDCLEKIVDKFGLYRRKSTGGFDKEGSSEEYLKKINVEENKGEGGEWRKESCSKNDKDGKDVKDYHQESVNDYREQNDRYNEESGSEYQDEGAYKYYGNGADEAHRDVYYGSQEEYEDGDHTEYHTDDVNYPTENVTKYFVQSPAEHQGRNTDDYILSQGTRREFRSIEEYIINTGVREELSDGEYTFKERTEMKLLPVDDCILSAGVRGLQTTDEFSENTGTSKLLSTDEYLISAGVRELQQSVKEKCIAYPAQPEGKLLSEYNVEILETSSEKYPEYIVIYEEEYTAVYQEEYTALYQQDTPPAQQYLPSHTPMLYQLRPSHSKFDEAYPHQYPYYVVEYIKEIPRLNTEENWIMPYDKKQ